MVFGFWVDSYAQSGNGWKVEDSTSTVREELGARSELISSSQIAALCDCMAGQWEEMLEPSALSRMRIRIADECVSAWPDGVVLSWRNSKDGMTLPLDAVVEASSWMDKMWMLGEDVWLVEVTLEGSSHVQPSEDSEVVEMLVVNNRAVAYLDEQAGDFCALTSLKSGKTGYVSRDLFRKLERLKLTINLGFSEVGRTGSETSLITVKDSTDPSIMLNVRKEGSFDSWTLAEGSETQIELAPGNFQYLCWAPPEMGIIPAFGVMNFEPGIAYRWVFFIETVKRIRPRCNSCVNFMIYHEGGWSTCQPTLLGHGGSTIREQSKRIQHHAFLVFHAACQAPEPRQAFPNP